MKILNLCFALLFSISCIAQEERPDRENRRDRMEERLEAQKIAFITKGLDLSTEEAQKFWPVYNDYQAEMKALKPDRKSRERAEDISSAEADKKLSEMMMAKRKALDVEEKYLAKMKTVLSSEKVLKLFHIEHRFKREMLSKLKRHRKEDGKRRGKMDK